MLVLTIGESASALFAPSRVLRWLILADSLQEPLFEAGGHFLVEVACLPDAVGQRLLCF